MVYLFSARRLIYFSAEFTLSTIKLGLKGFVEGVKASKVIRERFNVGTIFLNSHMDEDIIEVAMQAKPYGILKKPVDYDELTVLLNKVSTRLSAAVA